mmetsp:Transcript_28619/g.50389  ORF Transcript_28619/g.50389 Transcript_28619/m.50389 type:complete len:248 (-) Transcript_28619:954-1697(-)
MSRRQSSAIHRDSAESVQPLRGTTGRGAAETVPRHCRGSRRCDGHRAPKALKKPKREACGRPGRPVPGLFVRVHGTSCQRRCGRSDRRRGGSVLEREEKKGPFSQNSAGSRRLFFELRGRGGRGGLHGGASGVQEQLALSEGPTRADETERSLAHEPQKRPEDGRLGSRRGGRHEICGPKPLLVGKCGGRGQWRFQGEEKEEEERQARLRNSELPSGRGKEHVGGTVAARRISRQQLQVEKEEIVAC